MAKFDLRAYARQGAAARVAELNAELVAIYREFPDLRRKENRDDPFTRRGRLTANTDDGTTILPGKRRRRRRTPMTAEQKNAVSARMKKYWAARRAKKR